MTERTVTVQTEKEETIAVCNHCSVADDEDNVIEYGPWERQDQDDYEHIHFHRECLEELGTKVPEASTFGDEVLKTNRELSGPVLALPRIGIGLVAASYLFIGVGAYNQDLALVAAGVLLVLFNYAIGYKTANDTVEEMKS